MKSPYAPGARVAVDTWLRLVTGPPTLITVRNTDRGIVSTDALELMTSELFDATSIVGLIEAVPFPDEGSTH